MKLQTTPASILLGREHVLVDNANFNLKKNLSYVNQSMEIGQHGRMPMTQNALKLFMVIGSNSFTGLAAIQNLQMEDHAKKIKKEMALKPYFVLLVSFTLKQVFFSNPFLVSGGWSNWTLANDSYCFKDNDKWFKEFKRACNNPDPIFGGSCEGNDTKLEECKPSKFFITLVCTS